MTRITRIIYLCIAVISIATCTDTSIADAHSNTRTILSAATTCKKPTGKAANTDLKRRQQVVKCIRKTRWGGYCSKCLWMGYVYIDRAYIDTGSREFTVHGKYIEKRRHPINPFAWVSYVCRVTGTFYWSNQSTEVHEDLDSHWLPCHKW